MKVINAETGVVEWKGTLKEFRQKNYLDPKFAFESISKTAIKIERLHNLRKHGETIPRGISSALPDAVEEEYPYDENYTRPMIYEYELEEINQIAYEQITKYYPLWKQNNLIMEGDQVKLDAMNEFIQRVKDWANEENPDPDIIDTIVP